MSYLSFFLCIAFSNIVLHLPFVSSIVNFAKAAKTTRLVSLLQPGPETFCLFDEVILLAEGQLVYAGPIGEVEDYFKSLGYRSPNTMDVADFLQSVATPDGAMMFHAEESPMNEHYSASSFAQAFKASTRNNTTLAELSSPSKCKWSGGHLETVDEENPGQSGDDDNSNEVPKEVKHQYRNSVCTSIGLIVKRNLTLLKRDKDFLIGKTIENFGMGIGMALIFLQSAQFPSKINGSNLVADWFTMGCPEEGFTNDVATGKSFLLS